MQVTRHQMLDFEQTNQKSTDKPLDSEPFFVDWLTLRQSYPEQLPIINAGVVCGIDTHGEIEWQTMRATVLQGSFDTSVHVRCDGHTVLFSGNVSRFGRTNNLFGFSLAQCIRRVNNLLCRVGLPPFTAGAKFYRNVNTENGTLLKAAWTGCQITRIDMTANFETGSLSNARAYLEWLSTQQGNARLKVGITPDGETVHWGQGSRRLYTKIYLKSAELLKHNGPEQLAKHCEDVGLVRFEITVKATQLHAMGCNYLGGLDMAQLELLFEERKAVLTRAEHTTDDLEDLPKRLRCTARDWLAGDDIAKRMANSTFRAHRKDLLSYGIDIAVRRNVIAFKPRVRVIEVRPATVPQWYDFDERLVA